MVPGFPERELTDSEAHNLKQGSPSQTPVQVSLLSLSFLTTGHASVCLSLPPGKPLILAKMLTPHQDAAVSRPMLMAELTLFGFQPSGGQLQTGF